MQDVCQQCNKGDTPVPHRGQQSQHIRCWITDTPEACSGDEKPAGQIWHQAASGFANAQRKMAEENKSVLFAHQTNSVKASVPSEQSDRVEAVKNRQLPFSSGWKK